MINKAKKHKTMDRLEDSLTIEQDLSHRIFADQVSSLSREEAQELLIGMHKQMIYRENLYKELIRNREKSIVDMLFGANK